MNIHHTKTTGIIGLVLIMSLCTILGIWWYVTPPSYQKSNRVSQELRDIKDSLNTRYASLTQLDSTMLIDSSAQHILFIGDSMAEGLQIPFTQYANYNHHKLTTIAKRSASIISWVGRGDSGRLKNVIEEFSPSYIIICLGSNDLFTKGLTVYEKYLQNILAQAGNKKLIWICPPNWKKDNGLTDLIEEKVGTKRFFPSKYMQIKRAGDGIHPTYQGYFAWADSISSWIMKESNHKILLNKPIKEKKVVAANY